ncbi:hypothetical protein [Nocardia sp. NPDC003963]
MSAGSSDDLPRAAEDSGAAGSAAEMAGLFRRFGVYALVLAGVVGLGGHDILAGCVALVGFGLLFARVR